MKSNLYKGIANQDIAVAKDEEKDKMVDRMVSQLGIVNLVLHPENPQRLIQEQIALKVIDRISTPTRKSRSKSRIPGLAAAAERNDSPKRGRSEEDGEISNKKQNVDIVVLEGAEF